MRHRKGEWLSGLLLGPVTMTSIAGICVLLSLCLASPNANAAIAYVQSKSTSQNNSSQSSATATFSAAQVAGDLNVVAVGWGSTTITISSITDTKGNTYTLAVGPTVSNGTAAIYYAKNIVAAAAGANTVTVTFNAGAPFPDLRIAEYGGISTTSPLDVTAVAIGTGTTSDSGSATTSNANDLLIGSNWVLSGTTGPGTGYTQRQISGWDGDILEDQVVNTAGAYNATAPVSPSAAWIMQMAAFKAATSGGDTQTPTAPSSVTATAASSSQINLTWTASTDNVGVTGYRVESCQGASCATFAQIAAPTATSYNATGLAASTSYSFRIRATDAAGNLSVYSNTATTSTQSVPDTTPPGAPTGAFRYRGFEFPNQPELDGLYRQRRGDRIPGRELSGYQLHDICADSYTHCDQLQRHRADGIDLV